MPKYTLKFSTTTGKSTIHSPNCSNAKKRNGFTVATREATDAKAAAKLFDDEGELTDRGFPFPAICACTRYTEGVRESASAARNRTSSQGPRALEQLLTFRRSR